MVRDDDVHIELCSSICLFDCCDAAINSDQQVRACILGLLDSRDGNPISFTFAVRDIVADTSTQISEEEVEQAGGCDSIHIIISENEDQLLFL
ncbi:hypothetical protein BMS3Bbin04_01004 [bacterium BMS3Bbin04]|nr:hypothetical protein BMS3Bbin04_01004 [bacterium BMS3Bbin04]